VNRARNSGGAHAPPGTRVGRDGKSYPAAKPKVELLEDDGAAAEVKVNSWKSDRAIAAELGVDPETVRRARKRSTSANAEVEKRTGKDGKVRSTAHLRSASAFARLWSQLVKLTSWRSAPARAARAIAAELGVSDTTVLRARKQAASHEAPEKRVGRDGKSYPVRVSGLVRPKRKVDDDVPEGIEGTWLSGDLSAF
jgi:hypothetical protein